MSETQAGPVIETQAGPVIEGPGRYIVREGPAGDWVIGRALGLCERCTGCGCGEQAELVSLPDFTKGQAHVMQWMMTNMNGSLLGRLGG